MHFPKLTPLQSRFAASFLASAFLVLLYFTLTTPKFAYAADVDSIIARDHNHPILEDTETPLVIFDEDEDEYNYEPEFSLLDRSIIGRAPDGIISLANNDAQPSNINPGQTQNWMVPKEVLAGALSPSTPGLPSVVEKREEIINERVELRKRQDDTAIPGGSRRLYITLNTCLQPSSNATTLTDITIPPQLQIYISQSSDNQAPGPGQSDARLVQVAGGYGIAQLNADGDVYIGVTAPNVTDFSGIWNYEIAASIDGPFHNVDTLPNLFFVDSDSHAALMVTNDTTQAEPNSTVYKEWMKLTPPFGMFAHNQNDSRILGVQRSFCGLRSYAQISVSTTNNVAGEVGMTNRGLGGKPKEQFYVQDLNGSSTYYGFLNMAGNSTASGNGVVGGGGKVWQVMNFTTKQDDNCALIFNLSFCNQVAYAVPSSTNFSIPALTSLYDNYASDYYQFFNYSLQQIPCNTTSTAQYSLARNCTDCAAAYKTWLCAVTIPRCEDYSSELSYLFPRNTAQSFLNGTNLSSSSALPNPSTNSTLLTSVATNSSRNSIIDSQIKPGPYKEVLPCKDLCYDLVQSCPASLGFTCPYPGRGLEQSYGTRSSDGDITCSYLGAAYYLSGSERTMVSWFGLSALGSIWAAAWLLS